MSSIRKRFLNRGSQIRRTASNSHFSSDEDGKDPDKIEKVEKNDKMDKVKSNPKRLKNRSLSNKELKMITVMKEKNWAASRRQIKFDWEAEPQRASSKRDLKDSMSNPNSIIPSSKKAGEPLKLRDMELSSRQKQMRTQYLQLLDSIEQAIGEISDILSEVNRVLTDEHERSTKSAYSIVSLSSIVKDIKKIWDSETEYYEFEKKDNTNFIYVMEKIQQLPHNVKIPTEKLEALAQVTTITIREIHDEFNTSLERVTSNGYVSQAISLARQLRSVRKFLLGDVASSSTLSNLNRSTKAGIGGQIVRLQSLLKKEEDTTHSVIEAEEQSLHEMQEQVTESNTERYLIKLALRNLDRKIHLIIRSRKMQLEEDLMDMEYEEVLQFFDEQTQENPLGPNKETYERFVSLIRAEPKYITRLLPYLTFSDTDTLVHTITFSLFSDLSLGTEEALLLKVMERIMRAEFQETKAPRDFLRGTSFVSRLLSSYCVRQGGRTHLLQVLKEPVMAILNDTELSLEMDPQKLYLSLYDVPEEEVLRMDPTEIRKMPKILKRIKKHQNKLNQVCKYFLSTIIKSLPSMPFGMRWLAKLLAKLNAEALGDGPEATEERDILLGSYIFLRYYSPAIITPEEYGILPMNTPTYEARRNLLHIAKVIQNLANRCPFGEKEPFMVPMNRFLKANEQVLHSYFDQLINVGEPTYLFRRKESGLQKTIAISPNELFLLANRIFDNINSVLGYETEEERANVILPKQTNYSTPSYTPLTATPTGSTIRNTDKQDVIVADSEASETEKAETKKPEKEKEKGKEKEKKGKEKEKKEEGHEEEADEAKVGDASPSKDGANASPSSLSSSPSPSRGSSRGGSSRKSKGTRKKQGSGSDSENESGSEFKTLSFYSESESDGGRNKIDRIDRVAPETLEKRKNNVTRLSVRRNTVEKRRDFEKERRKQLRASANGKKQKPKPIPIEELTSTEDETEIVEIEVEDNAREDPLFDLLMRLQPVPSLFPKRKNKYLLLKIFDHASSLEPQAEPAPSEQEFKRTCETLRKSLCMLAPMDEILEEDDSHSSMSEFAHKQGNKQFLLDAVSKNEAQKAKEHEKGKEKEKEKSGEKGKEKVKERESARFEDIDYSKAWASMNILQMLEAVKNKVKPDDLSSIVTLLHVPQSKDGVKKKKKKVSKAKAMERLFKTIKKLKELPEEYKKDDFASLISALEQDYSRRIIYLSFLCTEKVEILQSLQNLRDEIESLYEEKAIYTEYLYNIQLKAFLARRKSKDIIGPYQYKISDLVKSGVIVSTTPPEGGGDEEGRNIMIEGTVKRKSSSAGSSPSISRRGGKEKGKAKAEQKASTPQPQLRGVQELLNASERDTDLEFEDYEDNDDDAASSTTTSSIASRKDSKAEPLNNSSDKGGSTKKASFSQPPPSSSSSSLSSSLSSSRNRSFSNLPAVAPLKGAQQAGTIKMSCTSPGCVNLVIQTHAGAQPQFFEMQLSNLMDELLTADTYTYGDITFDLRKIISFISKNLTG